MSLRLADADTALLGMLADLRVATLRQLATALDRNAHALRRRLDDLAEQGLIRVVPRLPRALRGRPEHMVRLCEPGFDLLRICGRLPPEMRWEETLADRGQKSEHDLLVSDFRVQLIQLQRFLPAVRVRDFGRITQSQASGAECAHSMQERFVDDETEAEIELFPDDVFSLTHRELGKTLLFFLEADRGTEPRTSAIAGRGLAAKIDAYCSLLRVGQYLRYEEILGATLRGFRLLLLIERSARWAAVSRLVRETSPSRFIWLTRRELLLQQGCWGPLWTVGGEVTAPCESILGSKMPQPCPTPAELRPGKARKGLADGDSA